MKTTISTRPVQSDGTKQDKKHCRAGARNLDRDLTLLTHMRLLPVSKKQRIWEREQQRAQERDVNESFGPEFLWWVLDLPDVKPAPLLEPEARTIAALQAHK